MKCASACVALVLATGLALPAWAGATTAVSPATAAASPNERPGQAPDRDYALLENRDKPITCKAGDIERHPGTSAGALFGADWPLVPGAQREPVEVLVPGRLAHPRGLESQRALVVVVVLVDAAGKPLRAEALCTTATGFDTAAKRFAMSAKYAPARVDGVPVVQPLAMVVKFGTVGAGARQQSAND
jgi:hypothetical protein